jgi:hypothetical protein
MGFTALCSLLALTSALPQGLPDPRLRTGLPEPEVQKLHRLALNWKRSQRRASDRDTALTLRSQARSRTALLQALAGRHQRKAQIGAALLNAGKGVAHENGFQPPAHGLHFRQFRHGVPA